MALRLTARAPLALPRRPWRFHLCHPCPCLMPAGCACTRHQARTGIDEIRVPPRALGLGAGLLQRAGPRLPCGIVCRNHRLERLPGCGDPRGVEGVQDGGGDGSIHTEAPERETRRGAPIAATAMAPRAWPPPRGPTLGHRELASAASTASHTTPQGRAPPCGSPSGVLWQGPIGLHAVGGLPQGFPTAGAGRGIEEEETPSLPRFCPARALPGTPVLEHCRGLCASRDQRAGSGGMGQHRVAPMAPGQAPEQSTARGAGVSLGQWHRFITIPEHRLASPAQCAARAEDSRASVWDLAVGALCTAIVGRPHEPHGDCPHDRPTLECCGKGGPRSLTHQGQRLGRARALHPPHEALVALTRIREAIRSKEQGSGQGTPIDHMMPGPVVAGHAGGVEGDDRSTLARTHGRQEWAPAWALWEAGATAPSVLSDHDNLGTPHATRVSGQRLLPPLALLMVADLMTSRLAHRDRGRAWPMRGMHLVAHGSSPCCARGG